MKLKCLLVNDALKERIQCQQMTGKSTTSLSFLPDDQQRHGMETETVALLPVLRRLEVITVSKGVLESAFVAKRFFHLWLPGDCWGKWCCPVLGWSSFAPGALVSHTGFQLDHSSRTPVLIHQVAPSLLGDEGEGAAVPLSEKIGKK